MSDSGSGSRNDVRDILAVIRRRKWLIIIPLPLVAIIAFASSYLIAPEYASSMIIQIDTDVQLITEVQRLIEPTGLNLSRSQDRSGILKSMYNELTSTRFVELLDERMQLTRLPEIEKTASGFVQLQPDMTIELARIFVLQGMLKSSISVEYASSDQVRIIVTSTSAAHARDIANNLGDIFIAEKIRQDLNQIRTSQDFSDVQFERYERQVQNKIDEITGVEQQLARLQNTDGTLSGANRVEIQGEIHQTESEMTDLRQDERRTISRLRGVADLNSGALTLVDSEAKREASQELLNRLRQIGDILSTHAWSDPQTINFKVRQNDLISTIESQNELLVNEQYAQYPQTVRSDLLLLFNTRDRLEYLISKKPYLEAALSDLAPLADRIPELEARQAQLERELQVATDIRDGFRRQQESSTISQALLEDRSSTKYRQVEPAKLAISPFSPDRTQVLVIGLVLGLAIGGAAILVVELMDNSFRKVEDVERVLELKVVGIVPDADFDKRLMR